MPEVVMPRLSDSMEEGTVLKWLKADGDEVHRGDELVEIETDKAAMVYEADLDGVLQIVAAEGATLPIGSVIAYVGGGENGSDGAHPAGGAGSAGATTAEQGRAETAAPPAGAAAGPHPAGGATGDGERVRASPLARRIARELGVDLRGLRGSGPGGRVVRADVEGAAAPAGTAEPARPAVVTGAGEVGTPRAGGVAAKGQVVVQELTRTQQVVARRMAESKATIPDFALDIEIDMEGAVALRAQLKELDREVVPTYNDMVVRACAIALREHPRANGSYRDGRFELHSRINVGVAVAAQDALIVPTVFDADAKSLTEIATETRALAARVREGVITPPELSGGTFTVSNLGMYGVTSFTAIINPPQAAILSVGALAQRAVVRDGALVARHTMSVTLACDHRILYGAEAAQFLARVRDLLERPLALGF
jgi:pyruvate dehydrogenase E2 component (dihydrolipoamide acetyltransferase)